MCLCVLTIFGKLIQEVLLYKNGSKMNSWTEHMCKGEVKVQTSKIVEQVSNICKVKKATVLVVFKCFDFKAAPQRGRFNRVQPENLKYLKPFPLLQSD